MPSFGRMDGQKCEASEPPRARTSLPIIPNNALQEEQFRGLAFMRQLGWEQAGWHVNRKRVAGHLFPVLRLRDKPILELEGS
jgi:hypothetical protein